MRAGLEASGWDALALFDPWRIAYLTGFHHLPTERPVALVLSEGYASLIVPAVEKEHAESAPGIDRVHVYFEYPGDTHPMQRVLGALRDVNAAPGRTAADADGYLPRWGYRGPRLSDLTGAPVLDGEMLVESLRRVKSETEVACIQLACDWAGKAHRRMHGSIEAGRTEMESYAPAHLESLKEMIAAMPGWRPRGFGSGLTAMFVGGRSTAMPHGFVRGHGVQAGDVLVSGAAADIDGYLSELERTFIVGEPSASQRFNFESMTRLQSLAISLLKPGVAAATIETEVLRLAEELEVGDRIRHHVGHSIGLEAHEAPFLDRGEEAILEPGMVFSVEPGLYLPALGGFRHSDTVVITGDGHRVMTEYPSDLDSLTIRA